MNAKDDGNISPWLEAQKAQIAGLRVGFSLAPGWYGAFERSLMEDPDAHRLVSQSLPRCKAPLLAAFVTMLAGTDVENRLVDLKHKRGEALKRIIRSAALRNPHIRKDAQAKEFMARASQAFDTRREGLADYCFACLIIQRYLEFRSGVKPTARELAALLKAGLSAAGRPARAIDYDLLRRNLRNYEKRHSFRFSGQQCAAVIELKPS